MKTITVKDLKALIDAGTAPRIIDVREDWEYEQDHITGENIPMGDIMADPSMVGDKDQKLIICCRSGGRSGGVTQTLTGSGYSDVTNLAGGMLAWKAEIDPNFNVQ
jgi:rhodanese-related sulfurtransferase